MALPGCGGGGPALEAVVEEVDGSQRRLTPSVRVLLLAEVGASGGIGRYCVDLAGMLREEVALGCLCLEHEDDRHESWLKRQARDRGLHLYNITMPARGLRQGRRGLLTLWQELGRPLLHVNGRRGNFLAMTSRLLERELRYVTTVHGLLGLHARRNLAYRLVDMTAARAASAVVSVSADTTRRLLSLGVPADIIFEVSNALPAAEIRRLRQGNSRRTSDGPLEIAFLGRLSREKGLEDFLRLARVLSGPERHLPAARFSVLGEGLLSPALERDTRELVSSGRLRFLGEVDDPATFLSEAHVLVMPSHNEGLPYALLEAMAAGLAVVAYGVGGIPEVVEDSSLGRLVRPRDFDALVAAVKGLMEDRPGLHALGVRAALHVAEKYTLESRREPMLELYERVGGQRWA